MKNRTFRHLLMTTAGTVIFVATPVLLKLAGIMNRPDNAIVRSGDAIYVGAVLAGSLALFLHFFRVGQGKPLTGVYSRQGLASVLIGVSGLMALAFLAPRFPEETQTVYLTGAGIIVFFAVLPLFLFHYASKKMSELDVKR